MSKTAFRGAPFNDRVLSTPAATKGFRGAPFIVASEPVELPIGYLRLVVHPFVIPAAQFHPLFASGGLHEAYLLVPAYVQATFTDDNDTILADVTAEEIGPPPASLDVFFLDEDDTINASADTELSASIAFTDDDDTIIASTGVRTAVSIAFTDDDDTILSDAQQLIAAVIEFIDDDDAILAFSGAGTRAYAAIVDTADAISAAAVAEPIPVSFADIAFIDTDDAIHIAAGEPVEPEPPPTRPGGVVRPPKPRKPKPFTYTYPTYGDIPVTLQARLDCVLDDLVLDAYAEVGVQEKRIERRRAAIATLIA